MKLRPAVQRFAEAMERQLRENDNKGGWQHCRGGYLVRRLREETQELLEVLGVRCAECGHLPDGPEDKEENKRVVVHEAADVANFAMMIADKFGDLRYA